MSVAFIWLLINCPSAVSCEILPPAIPLIFATIFLFVKFFFPLCTFSEQLKLIYGVETARSSSQMHCGPYIFRLLFFFLRGWSCRNCVCFSWTLFSTGQVFGTRVLGVSLVSLCVIRRSNLFLLLFIFSHALLR